MLSKLWKILCLLFWEIYIVSGTNPHPTAVPSPTSGVAYVPLLFVLVAVRCSVPWFGSRWRLAALAAVAVAVEFKLKSVIISVIMLYPLRLLSYGNFSKHKNTCFL